MAIKLNWVQAEQRKRGILANSVAQIEYIT